MILSDATLSLFGDSATLFAEAVSERYSENYRLTNDDANGLLTTSQGRPYVNHTETDNRLSYHIARNRPVFGFALCAGGPYRPLSKYDFRHGAPIITL
jgi:hypothetical protein